MTNTKKSTTVALAERLDYLASKRNAHVKQFQAQQANLIACFNRQVAGYDREMQVILGKLNDLCNVALLSGVPEPEPVDDVWPKRIVGQRGRPRKLNSKVADAVCAAIAGGAGQKEAAAIAGVGLSSLTKWISLGRAGKTGYTQLYDQINRAYASRCVAINASQGNGTTIAEAAAALMEPMNRAKLEKKLGHPINNWQEIRPSLRVVDGQGRGMRYMPKNA